MVSFVGLTHSPITLAGILDIKDVEEEVIEGICEWYQVYKVADKKQPNRFLNDEPVKNKKFAFIVLDKAHKSWVAEFAASRAKKTQDAAP